MSGVVALRGNARVTEAPFRRSLPQAIASTTTDVDTLKEAAHR